MIPALFLKHLLSKYLNAAVEKGHAIVGLVKRNTQSTYKGMINLKE